MSEIGKMTTEDGRGRQRQRRLGSKAIGDRLRQMYNGVVEESVPDDFLRLLEQAEAKAKAENPDKGGGDT